MPCAMHCINTKGNEEKAGRGSWLEGVHSGAERLLTGERPWQGNAEEASPVALRKRSGTFLGRTADLAGL